MTQLCGQFIMLVGLLLVNLLRAIIGVLKLSLVLHDVTVLLRYYFILVCQVLILLHNCKAIFMRTWLNSSNSIVLYVRRILVS